MKPFFIPSVPKVTNSTDEQLIVINYPTTTNAVIEAMAGSGKSTTILLRIVKLVNDMREQNIAPHKCIGLVAFGSKIALELKSKIALYNLSQWVDCGTVHSFGNAMLARKFGWFKPDGSKLFKIVSDVLKDRGRSVNLRKSLCRMISLGKNNGIYLKGIDITWQDIISTYSIEWDESECKLAMFLELADFILQRSIDVVESEKWIDFDDQLYMPIYHDLVHPKPFKFIFVDEAQDTNQARLQVITRMCQWGDNTFTENECLTQLMAVGDTRQSIMGFTGALNNALAQIRGHFNAETLTLSYCFRCSRQVVIEAQKLVPGIKPAPGAIEGSVSHTSALKFYSTIPEKTSAVLCRVNAPLVELAFKYLSAGVACHIEGKDIGASIITLITKWKIFTLNQLEPQLEKYFHNEIEKLLANGLDMKISEVEDKRTCVFALMQRCRNIGKKNISDLQQLITDLFVDSEPGVPSQNITLCSVHKSKGLEWPTVYILGANLYMPHPKAFADWELEQEDNLLYVAITRAQEHLIYVNLDPKQ